ncbi:hypothetical protein GLAD_03739 [Leclercia adecarboxylata ATCC 23216 = NBRC 102595]|nr:hypothetical protein GLAD_03739 [Leclercia adecarboxylata ATCC 23216 = NBRC 102595]
MVCKLAKLLNVPENYFYTIDDVMAEMVLKFNKLNIDAKTATIKFMNDL